MKLIKTLNNKKLPTNALCIALGKFDNTMIKCARFKGTTKEFFIDKKEFNNDLFSNIDNTIKFLQNNLNLNAKVEGIKLKEHIVFFRKQMPSNTKTLPKNSEYDKTRKYYI